MQREIGSDFDLSPQAVPSQSGTVSMAAYGFCETDGMLLSRGRTAQGVVLEDILQKQQCSRVALVPPFTCHTVLEPFLERGFRLIPYTVDSMLRVEPETFARELTQWDVGVVLVHRYFGFDTLPGILPVIREFQARGVIFIEDRTQTLYSRLPELSADYCVGSFRKWAFMPDGGYAVSRRGSLGAAPVLWDTHLQAQKLEAAALKYAYLHEGTGDKQRFLDLYRAAEEHLDRQTGCMAMSPVSRSIQASLDIPQLKEKRRRNYRLLYNALKDLSGLRLLTPELGAQEVPLYLALCHENRSALQLYLRQRSIYAPVVWPKGEACPPVCPQAEEIYRTILCLPIDQRYDPEDMERMARCVEEFTNGDHQTA